MAKRATSRKGRKAAKKAGRRGAPKVGGEIASALAKLDEEKNKALAQIEAQRKELLEKGIEAKKAAIAKAQEAAAKSQANLAKLEQELQDMLVEAGIAKPKTGKAGKGRKSAGKSGRKPRVSVETKKAAVSAELKNTESGTPFSELREKLLKVTDPASGGPIFATTDFNSASKFGARYLPRGWKIKGERKNAIVAKGR
ncbi:MAG: hypothetical protein PWP23_2960 [Candidatus Sumerlaeota bacterium]|nr:hypothetical protein [Candidatus Sumerlaeota bacterium]